METVANLFLYIEDGIIKSLGAIGHPVESTDDEQTTGFLKARVAVDSAAATRYDLPVDSIKAWLGYDAINGLPYKYFSFLHRTGKALWLFEVPLQAISAPEHPFVCFTSIVNGKPQADITTHANPLVCPLIHTREFDGLVKDDWLAMYITDAGLNVHDLLNDDFTEAIKLLYLHKHYVAAMKLIVSFIDTLAYLEYGDVVKNYETWLSTFADLGPAGINPEEMWEFRNSILHMTNPLSRKVQAGKVMSLYFYVSSSTKTVLIDQENETKMFSFNTLYETIIEALDKWTKSYTGNLSKQLTFIERYDTIMSEGRLGSLTSDTATTTAKT